VNLIPLNIGDLDTATSHLSCEELGVYLRLLMRYYAGEMPLAENADQLLSICRLAPNTKASAKAFASNHERVEANASTPQQTVLRVVEQFFQRKGGKLHNRRADEEIARYRAIRKKRQEAGHSGGVARTKGLSKNGLKQKPSICSYIKPLISTTDVVDIPPSKDVGVVEPNPTTNVTTTRSARARRVDGAGPAPRDAPPPGAASAAWAAYVAAYSARYGVEPVRNARVNTQVAAFVKRVPADEAPAIASFYVRHDRRLYVSAGHAVDLLLRDAEKLRTEWATGRQITEEGARKADARVARIEVWDGVRDELRGRAKHGKTDDG
jgi:uncharacterized protein YdaU (DUF1376 family)